MIEMKSMFYDLAKTHSLYTVFFDFIKLSAISISNGIDKVQFESREEEYHQIIEKYSKEQLDVFPKILALLVSELNNNMRDVLGEIYMDLGISDKKGDGQVFTPWYVAKLMANLNMSPQDEDKLIEAYDTCVGGGVMMLAMASVLNDRGIDYQQRLRVYCSDIDRNVLLMCYLQLSILGVDAICEVKSAFDKEAREVWFTLGYAKNRLNGGVQSLENKLKKSIEIINSDEKFEQLVLF